MKITKRGEYGLKALLALAFAYGRRTLSLREISEQEGLPVKFLEQIMMSLRQGGVVGSTKGKHGGYFLARAPAAITLGEVIRTIDGPLAPWGTAREIQREIQKNNRHAGFYSVLLDVRNAISEILDKKTLAEVCEKSLELASAKSSRPMYYI